MKRVWIFGLYHDSKWVSNQQVPLCIKTHDITNFQWILWVVVAFLKKYIGLIYFICIIWYDRTFEVWSFIVFNKFSTSFAHFRRFNLDWIFWNVIKLKKKMVWSFPKPSKNVQYKKKTEIFLIQNCIKRIKHSKVDPWPPNNYSLRFPYECLIRVSNKKKVNFNQWKNDIVLFFFLQSIGSEWILCSFFFYKFELLKLKPIACIHILVWLYFQTHFDLFQTENQFDVEQNKNQRNRSISKAGKRDRRRP